MKPTNEGKPPVTVRLDLAPEIERILKERAGQRGLTLEAYLEQVVEREARSGDAMPGEAATAPDDFERGLDELSEGLPALAMLPADLSRADTYGS